MSLTTDMGSYLTALGLLGGTTDWVLAENWVPPSPDTVVVLTQAGGYAPATKVSLDYPELQVRVRGTARAAGGVAAAMAKAEAIYRALDGLGPIDIAGSHYNAVLAQHAPASMGEDQNGRPEFVTNFLCWRSR